MGVTSRCKNCTRSTPEYRAYHRRWMATWRRFNLEVARERGRSSYRRRRERVLIRMKAAYDAGGRVRALRMAKVYAARRRARVAAALGSHSAWELFWILVVQGGQCWYCAEPLAVGFEPDHLVPLSRGGSNDANNICCACRPCNVSKGPKTAEEFFAYREGLGLRIAQSRDLWSTSPVLLERWPGDLRSLRLADQAATEEAPA